MVARDGGIGLSANHCASLHIRISDTQRNRMGFQRSSAFPQRDAWGRSALLMLSYLLEELKHSETLIRESEAVVAF